MYVLEIKLAFKLFIAFSEYVQFVLYHWFAVLTLGFGRSSWFDTQRPTFGSVMWTVPAVPS